MPLQDAVYQGVDCIKSRSESDCLNKVLRTNESVALQVSFTLLHEGKFHHYFLGEEGMSL